MRHSVVLDSGANTSAAPHGHFLGLVAMSSTPATEWLKATLPLPASHGWQGMLCWAQPSMRRRRARLGRSDTGHAWTACRSDGEELRREIRRPQGRAASLSGRQSW